jgi:hypothetical protein
MHTRDDTRNDMTDGGGSYIIKPKDPSAIVRLHEPAVIEEILTESKGQHTRRTNHRLGNSLLREH